MRTIWKDLDDVRRRRADLTDADWLDTFLFYNEIPKLVRDVFNTTALGYRYQDVPLPLMVARPTETA
jgi:polyphenol oxidase